MLKKKLTKYLWFGSDVDSKDNPITPQPAPEGEPLDGLNEGELYIHNNSKNPTLYTLSSDGEVVPIGGNTDVFDKRYIRKDKDDRSVGKISSDKGFEAGTYVKGLVGGSGAWIGADGYGEMSGLTLREFLEVPELRFNRVDVVSGELWNAVAFGLVEEVEITGEETGILKIKLEENERCGLHVGDYCRGIFADFSSGSNWEGPDECNFLHLYGFWTSYFTPKTIIENKEGLFVCEYALKPETKQHPTKSMKFAVYGHPTDTKRQASAYATRTYKRYLNNVDTWVIEPDRHIYAQYGDLNGLVINGVEMKGYGSYQSNAYFKGVQIQLSPEQLESLKGDSAYAAQLTNNVGTIRLDKNGNMAEGLYEESIVTAIKDGEEAEVTAKDENGQESSVTVTNHKLTTTVQAYKGNVPLFYSTTGTSGSFTVSLTCVGCTAFVVNGSVVVSSITSTKDCRVNVTVNCEGMAVYNLVYNILFVKDGKDGINGSDGSNGAPGSPGADASVYTVLPNLTAISRTVTGSLSPSNVTFTCYKDTGTSDRTEESATWKMYGRNTADESWSEIKTQDSYSSTFSVGFSDSYKYYRIEAYPYGTRPIVLEPFIVSDGTPGTNGKRGAIARYCGEYKEGVEYVYNDEFRDIVIYKGNVFQVLSYGSTVTDAPTVSDSSDNDGKWQMASKFNFVAMDTALIDNANIAGFVFTRDGYKDGAPYGRLSSQLSTDGVPNLEIDAYNGSIHCNNVDLSGVINATGGIFKNIDVVSGTIGGLTISENSISSAKGNKGMKIQGESILFDFSGTEFIRINSSSSEKTLFYGRMDDGVLMDLRAYGAGATALNILCNSSGFGKAIDSIGEHSFISRYSSSSTYMEQTMIAGLSLSCRNGTTFSAPSNVSNNTSAWVDFLVATDDFQLPNANSCPGKILFVKFTGNYTAKSSSYIVSAADNSTSTRRTRDTKAMFYISNGTNWYEFYCG